MNRFIQKVLDLLLPWRWWAAYQRHIERITTSGYMGTPSPTLEAITRRVFKVWRWIQVGRVTIVNAHHLNTPGRIVVAANHSSMLDAIIALPMMHRPCWVIGAYEPLREFFGLPALVLTKLRVIPVDRSKGKTVLKVATDCLVAGNALGLYPEGKISSTGELLPFKPGVGLIAKAAFEQLGGKETVAIIPIHYCYGKRHVPSALHFGKMWLRWRGGCTLTVCEPIWLHKLEDQSVDHIVCLVRKAIESVSCATTYSVTSCEK